MNEQVRLFSEPFSATGNVVSEGIWNQLGRPELDRLTLLLRESCQNSWDAREGPSIDYGIASHTLSKPQREVFRTFFANTPPPQAYSTESRVAESIVPLQAWMDSESPRVLMVYDRGTRGLDGPTRANEPTWDGEERNFVDFLRNVGQPPAKQHGGGTFGYGKAAFYLASRTRTIVVHTCCSYRGALEERLTAAALTHNFEHRGLRYTGRHWWGASDSMVGEPLTGSAASSWGQRLGLPAFREGQKGTTIAVIEPDFTDEELSALPWMCLRNLWPKLEASDKGRPPISVRIQVAGQHVPVPAPSVTPPYDGFWRALSEIRSGKGEEVSYRTDVVGSLALRHAAPVAQANLREDLPEHEMRPRHVALLRSPELVVKYLDGGRSLGEESMGFTGVFLASKDADTAFAQSEPPTHDDWQPASVRDKRNKGIVNTALKKIREKVREFATPHVVPTQSGGGASLAGFANDLALLLPGASTAEVESRGQGAERSGGGSRRNRGNRPQARMLPEERVEERDGKAYLLFEIEVAHAVDTKGTRMTAEVYAVVAGGGREAETPNGMNAPRVGWWESPRGARIEGPSVLVGPRMQGVWKLYVPADDAAVAVEVRATAEAGP